MKFILTMIICTSVYNTCLPPHQMDEVYNTHYECMIAGYNESIDKAKVKMDEAKLRLQDGPGSLIKKVEKMKKLGRLNTKKSCQAVWRMT